MISGPGPNTGVYLTFGPGSAITRGSHPTMSHLDGKCDWLAARPNVHISDGRAARAPYAKRVKAGSGGVRPSAAARDRRASTAA
jgi:hypothetical protein